MKRSWIERLSCVSPEPVLVKRSFVIWKVEDKNGRPFSHCQRKKSGRPVVDACETICYFAPHSDRQQPAGNKRRDARAALEVRELVSAQWKVGAAARRAIVYKKTRRLFLSLPYVCPEPVLVK